MANRFFNPDQQFCDATGLPYAGGSLTFYASGTTTPLNTYSDSALTIANPNPLPLDSAGRSGSVFLQNLAYKVVLADVNNNVIWTFDPVYSSDFSTVAQFQSGSGSPNGVVAGTAGSATIPASSYWDATNNILYICTQTGTAATAVWTAINSASAAAVVPPPQGYLTLISGTPVITGDALGGSSVFYTPYIGNTIPVYNGTSFTPTVFSELTCTLVSAHLASTIYDLFVFNNSGILTLVTGPAWTSSTAGSSSRGTGSGTTQLTRLNGLWVNTVPMTGRNGITTYSIPASQATYVGSMFVDGIAGQVSCHRSFGQSRKWGIWNAYNRVPVILFCGDSTASWTLTGTTSARALNNNATNSFFTFFGLPEEEVNTELAVNVNIITGSGSVFYDAQIGLNSSTVNAGRLSSVGIPSGNGAVSGTAFAGLLLAPTLGINGVFAMESVISTGSVTVTAFGQVQMGMTATFRA